MRPGGDNTTPVRSRLPTWVGGLTALGLLGGATLLAMLTSHLVEVRQLERDVYDQRRVLEAVSTALAAPIAQLEHNHTALFAAGRPPQPLEFRELTAAMLEIDQRAGAARDAIVQVGIDFRAARARLDESMRWRQRLTTAQTTWRLRDQATRASIETIETLIADAPPGRRDAAATNTARLEATLQQLQVLLLRYAYEDNERRSKKIARDLVRALDFAADHATAIALQRGEAMQPLRTAVRALRRALLGTDGTGGDSSGLVGARADHLAAQFRGADLGAGLAAAIRTLHDDRVGIQSQISAAAVRASQSMRAATLTVWQLGMVVGALLGLAFAAIGLWVRRLARNETEALQTRRRSADAALRSQNLFLASMSHEIRTPMNGVLGMAEMLETGPLDEEQRQIAGTIRTSAESLLTVINDVLDFSKLEAGKFELDCVDFDIRRTIGDTLDLLNPLSNRKGNELICTLDHRLPRHVHGDPDRLRQILLNLLGNAIKFTDNGLVTTVVTLLGAHRDVVRLEVKVHDTGVGMTRAMQARLFKQFGQGSSDTARQFGGTGLGLTIAKRLVGMMGGDITVQSEPGVGSTFAFTLTLAAAVNPPEPEPTLDLRGRAALVVDDSVATRENIALHLAGWNMGFDLAESATEGLDLLLRAHARGRPFDVALIDLGMDDMTGLELAQQVAAAPGIAVTRCIVLSSEGPRPADFSLEDLHVHAWLQKPIRASRLRHCLQSLFTPGDADAAGRVDDPAEAPLALQVLVAEDDAVNRRVMMRVLQHIGCTVLLAENGVEALEMVRTLDCDLVLMDCQMPEMNGWDATRAIRKLDDDKRGVPIIALTASVLPEDRRACLEAGMDDFLTKPIKRDALRAALVKWRGTQPAAVAAEGGAVDGARAE